MLVVAHLAWSHVADYMRILVVSGMGAMVGALAVAYVFGLENVRYPERPLHTQPMFWGGLAAICLLFGAIADQLGRVGDPVTWRLPLYAAMLVFAYLAIRADFYWRRKDNIPRRRRARRTSR